MFVQTAIPAWRGQLPHTVLSADRSELVASCTRRAACVLPRMINFSTCSLLGDSTSSQDLVDLSVPLHFLDSAHVLRRQVLRVFEDVCCGEVFQTDNFFYRT